VGVGSVLGVAGGHWRRGDVGAVALGEGVRVRGGRGRPTGSSSGVLGLSGGRTRWQAGACSVGVGA
ncbi:hypothetical protein, partial [Kribbella solani]|uniref:hypothetical protein n=1 Tax=Kribbella solani TaxID=236067 RepID=UPI0029BB47A5